MERQQRLQTLVHSPDGQVLGVNRARLAEIPYFLLTNPPNNVIPVTAQQASPQLVMSLSGEGPGQMLALSRAVIRAGALQADTRLRMIMQIQDGQGIRGLMNGAVHLDTIAGTGRQPYRLPEGLYLDELRSVIVQFTNLDPTNDADVRFAMLGQRYLTQQVDVDLTRIRARLDRRQYLTVPYFYTLDQGPAEVPAGTTAQFPITVGQDHHFEIHQYSRVIYDAAFGTGPFPWAVNIVDVSKGESIIDAPQSSNQPVNGELFFGSGNFPFKAEPRLVLAGMRLVVTIVNNHTAPLTFYLTLGGRAIADRMWR